MRIGPSGLGKMGTALLAASAPPTLLVFACFLGLCLVPHAAVADPSLLTTFRVLSGLAFHALLGLLIWVALTFVEPSRRVALCAKAVADGGLPPSLPRRGRDDEIDLIADSIATTASTMKRLRVSRGRLRALNRALADRVAERTEELAASTRRLEQACAEVAAARRELQRRERLAALGSMVAGLAHELNTPIGNAVTSASVLAREIRRLRAGAADGAAAERLERASDLLERSLARAAELVGTFKQVSVDQASAQRRTFDLHDAVLALHDTVSSRLRRAGRRLRIMVPVDIRLDSYPGPLEQALYNLVENASVHAFEGRCAGTVDIRAERDGEIVRIAVEDDGIGIAPDMQPFVFEPFVSSRMGRGGSGLGLHMVRTTVTGLLGGQVSLDSAPGRGTRVVIEIPATAPAARAA